MTRTKLIAAVATFGLLAAVPAIAHHSLASEFDTNQRVTLRGSLTKLEWVNPHVWLHLDVKGPDGKVVSWLIEGGAPNSLIRRGVFKNTLPFGADIVVQAYRSRMKPDSVGHGFAVMTPDGKELYLGASSDAEPDK